MKSISKQMQIFFIIIICLFSILLFAFSLFTYNKSNLKNILANNRNLCNSLKYNIDSETNKLNDISMDTIYYLTQNPGILTRRFREINTKMKIEIYNEIFELLGSNLDAAQINICLNNGAYLGNGFDTLSANIKPDELSHYNFTYAKKGSKYIALNPSSVSKPALYENYLLLSRTFGRLPEYPAGIVEVYQSKNKYFKFIDTVKTNNPDADFLIFDNETGSLIYPYDLDRQSHEYNYLGDYYNIIKENQSLELSIYRNNISKAKKIAVYTQLDSYDWSIAVIQPYSLLTNALYEEIFKFACFMAIAILFIFFLYNKLVKHVLAPLEILKTNVQKIDMASLLDENTNFLPSPPSSTQEVLALGKTFEEMYENLRLSTAEVFQLKERENDANFRALQALVDPHFIYNNIAAISALAEDKRCNDIVSFSNDLCEIIRYTSNRNVNSVSLKEELDFVRRYLECMRIRYGSDLQYQILVPESMNSFTLPKLSIQTFVENSIKHGFEISPPLSIIINGTLDPIHWEIEIIDNGIGFDETQLDEILGSLNSDSDRLDPEKLKLGGMGIANAIFRMKIQNKNSYFKIKNNEGNGCSVIIGETF